MQGFHTVVVDDAQRCVALVDAAALDRPALLGRRPAVVVRPPCGARCLSAFLTSSQCCRACHVSVLVFFLDAPGQQHHAQDPAPGLQ